MRDHPAIDVRHPGGWPPDGDLTGLVLADVDEFGPTAVEDLADGVRVFFASSLARDAARDALNASKAFVATAVDVPDESWAERSQASLGAIAAGTFVVAPPWAVPPDLAGPPPHLIVIQPSMGFGTAHHASTRLCLRLLGTVPLAGRAVLDVGTGSGVLAIAAARLGAARVAACDVDPDALLSARENLDLNDATGRVELYEADLGRAPFPPGRGFDVIVANLTAALLCREARRFAEWASADATLVASGLQPADVAAVIAAFAADGWTSETRQDEDDWTGLVLRRRATSPTSSTGR